MTKTFEGRVVGGKIELLEPLDAPDGATAKVLVDVADDDPYLIRNPRRASFGSLRPADGRYTTEEDWQEAKKMWEPRDL